MPVFDCRSPNKKSFYLTGIYSGQSSSGAMRAINADAYWRDGCLWKVDVATGKASIFYSIKKEETITDLKKRTQSPIGSARGSYAAFHGVAVDLKNRVFLCDRQHDRILVLDQEAKVIRKIPVKYPDAIALSPDAKSIYVTVSWYNKLI